jgi:hypothetical protein
VVQRSQRGRNDVTADAQPSQGAHRRRRSDPQKCLVQAGHEERVAHVVGRDQTGEGQRVRCLLVLRQDQTAARSERPEHVDRCIEGQRRLQEVADAARGEQFAVRVDPGDDGAVGDPHGLGTAGRPGREHHIGKIVRLPARARLIRRGRRLRPAAGVDGHGGGAGGLGERLAPSSCTEDRSDSRRADQRSLPGRGVGDVDRHERGTCAQDRQQGNDHAGHSPTRNGYPVSRLHPAELQGGGEEPDAGLELRAVDRLLLRDEHRAVGEAPFHVRHEVVRRRLGRRSLPLPDLSELGVRQLLDVRDRCLRIRGGDVERPDHCGYEGVGRPGVHARTVVLQAEVELPAAADNRPGQVELGLPEWHVDVRDGGAGRAQGRVFLALQPGDVGVQRRARRRQRAGLAECGYDLLERGRLNESSRDGVPDRRSGDGKRASHDVGQWQGHRLHQEGHHLVTAVEVPTQVHGDADDRGVDTHRIGQGLTDRDAHDGEGRDPQVGGDRARAGCDVRRHPVQAHCRRTRALGGCSRAGHPRLEVGGGEGCGMRGHGAVRCRGGLLCPDHPCEVSR